MGAELHPHGISRASRAGRRVHRAGLRQMDGVVVSVKLHPCPYCQSEEVAVEETDIGGYVVACGCCGMTGPEAPFAGIAVRRWEILCSRMCSHCRTNLLRHFTTRIRELKAELDALQKCEAPPDV